MSKLEYDLENFGRLCHLHDKVAKLEQALAEKDRESVKWSELIGSFTRSQHRYLVEMERLKQALAEKDREIQQIREHEFQRGYQEAEEKYQQILEKSVKLAEEYRDAEQRHTN